MRRRRLGPPPAHGATSSRPTAHHAIFLPIVMDDSGKGPKEAPLSGTCARLRRTSRSSEAVPGAALLHGTSNLLTSPHAPFTDPRRDTTISPGAALPDADASAPAAASASGTR
eukprot:12638460-Alexandrium_andersonii.AAC.1